LRRARRAWRRGQTFLQCAPLYALCSFLLTFHYQLSAAPAAVACLASPEPRGEWPPERKKRRAIGVPLRPSFSLRRRGATLSWPGPTPAP